MFLGDFTNKLTVSDQTHTLTTFLLEIQFHLLFFNSTLCLYGCIANCGSLCVCVTTDGFRLGEIAKPKRTKSGFVFAKENNLGVKCHIAQSRKIAQIVSILRGHVYLNDSENCIAKQVLFLSSHKNARTFFSENEVWWMHTNE